MLWLCNYYSFHFSSLKNFKPGEIYNIADDQPLSNEEIVNEVIEKYSLKLPPFVDYKDLKNSTVKDFYLSSKKIKNDKAKSFFSYKLIRQEPWFHSDL